MMSKIKVATTPKQFGKVGGKHGILREGELIVNLRQQQLDGYSGPVINYLEKNPDTGLSEITKSIIPPKKVDVSADIAKKKTTIKQQQNRLKTQLEPALKKLEGTNLYTRIEEQQRSINLVKEGIAARQQELRDLEEKQAAYAAAVEAHKKLLAQILK